MPNEWPGYDCDNCEDTGKVHDPNGKHEDDWVPCPNGCKGAVCCSECGDEGRIVAAVVYSPAMDGPMEILVPCPSCVDRYDSADRVF